MSNVRLPMWLPIALIMATVASVICAAFFSQVPGWQATLPAESPLDDQTFRVTTTNLAGTFPFLHHRAGTAAGMLAGFSDPGREVATLDPFDSRLPNHNLACIGYSGSGKTMFAQGFALRHAAKGYKIVVLDRSNGHWDAMVRLAGGASHRMPLDGSLGINPWELRGDRLPQHDRSRPVPRSKIDYLIEAWS